MPSLWCASPEGGNLQTFLQTCKLYKRMVCIHFGSAPTAPSPSPIPHHIESWEICEVPTGAHIRAIRNTRAGDKRKKHSNRNKCRTKTAKKILFFFFPIPFSFFQRLHHVCHPPTQHTNLSTSLCPIEHCKQSPQVATVHVATSSVMRACVSQCHSRTPAKPTRRKNSLAEHAYQSCFRVFFSRFGGARPR
jgi:hypothetical protein